MRPIVVCFQSRAKIAFFLEFCKYLPHYFPNNVLFLIRRQNKPLSQMAVTGAMTFEAIELCLLDGINDRLDMREDFVDITLSWY